MGDDECCDKGSLSSLLTLLLVSIFVLRFVGKSVGHQGSVKSIAPGKKLTGILCQTLHNYFVRKSCNWMVMLESLMMHTIVLGFSGYLDAVTELCVASDVIQLKIEVLAV